MEAIYIGNPIQDKFFRERGRTRLRGCENEDRRIVGLCKVSEETGKF
jgi:hypothetical protein